MTTPTGEDDYVRCFECGTICPSGDAAARGCSNPACWPGMPEWLTATRNWHFDHEAYRKQRTQRTLADDYTLAFGGTDTYERDYPRPLSADYERAHRGFKPW